MPQRHNGNRGSVRLAWRVGHGCARMVDDAKHAEPTQEPPPEAGSSLSSALNSELLQSILDSMADGVVVADENGRMIQFNPEATRILGVGMTDEPLEKWSQHYGVYLWVQ